MHIEEIKFKLAKFAGRYSISNASWVPSNNDFIISEFPKSGVTFFAHLLVNCLLSDKREANFFNLHQFMYDVHRWRGFSAPELRNNVRIYKTHHELNRSVINQNYGVYLFRDPIDVMVSYYNYVNGFYSHHDQSFSNFVRSHRGVVRWVSHLSSFSTLPANANFIPLDYLTLYNDPYKVLKKLNELYSWKIEDATIQRAIEKSSISNMSKYEKLYKRGGREFRENFMGSKSFRKSDISRHDIEYIMNKCDKIFHNLKIIEDQFWGDD